jgi:hypothetical protein
MAGLRTLTLTAVEGGQGDDVASYFLKAFPGQMDGLATGFLTTDDKDILDWTLITNSG